MSELTEAEIVEAVRRGRREGQAEMVGRYAKRVFAMIARMVPDMMDAQELTQDTFLKAFSHIGGYDPQRSSLSTWLCRIGYRQALDFLKRGRPLIVAMENDEGVCDEDVELSTGREELIEQLMGLVDELPDEERMLVTLYYFEDRPLTEIAYTMDVDAKLLAKRLYRMRKKLHQKLKEMGD